MSLCVCVLQLIDNAVRDLQEYALVLMTQDKDENRDPAEANALGA